MGVNQTCPQHTLKYANFYDLHNATQSASIVLYAGCNNQNKSDVG